MNWFDSEYGKESSATPVILHQRAVVEKSGTAPDGTRVMTPDKLEALKAATRAYATALAVDENYRDSSKVAEQLESHKLTGGALIPAYTVSSKRER